MTSGRRLAKDLPLHRPRLLGLLLVGRQDLLQIAADSKPDGRGRCDLTRNPFETRCTGWKEAKASTGWKRIDFGAIAAVGISVSPDYLDHPEAIRPAIEMFPEINGMLNARIERCEAVYNRDFQAAKRIMFMGRLQS